jgi:hypothetical protein
MNQKIGKLLIILSLLLIATCAGCVGNRSKSPEAMVTATIIIDFGNGTILKFEDLTMENATVYDFTLEAAKQGGFSVNATYYEMGVFVDSIAGVGHGRDIGTGDEDLRWWQYYVNGGLGSVAANKLMVNNSDVIEWRFEIPPWGKLS